MPPPMDFEPDIVLALRHAAIIREQVRKLTGQVLDGEKLNELCDHVVYAMNHGHMWPWLPPEPDETKTVGEMGKEPKGCDEKRWKILGDYVGGLAGMPFTIKQREELCYRFAVCAVNIERGYTFPDFESLKQHWTVLRIESVQHTKPSEKGSSMVYIVFRILHGKWGGQCFGQRMPLRYLVFKLAREIGFPQYGAIHMLELAGAVLGGCIERIDGRTVMSELGELPHIVAFNQRLRRNRAKPCVHGFKWLCHQCSLGYLTGAPEPCPRATHPLAYHRQVCQRCKKEGWFDYDNPGEYACLECIGRAAKRRARLS